MYATAIQGSDLAQDPPALLLVQCIQCLEFLFFGVEGGGGVQEIQQRLLGGAF